MTQSAASKQVKAPLHTPSGLSQEAVANVSGALNPLLADTFALYLKTKNFHWHMSGPHFRDYHLLLDEQDEQIFAMTDDIAERVRKIGGTTLRSIGHIAKLQRVRDNDRTFVPPQDAAALAAAMRAAMTSRPGQEALDAARQRIAGEHSREVMYARALRHYLGRERTA